MAMRREDDISILSWAAACERPTLSVEVKALLDHGGIQALLIDMSEVDAVRADSLEALNELTTVCRERDCKIGLYGLRDGVARLVEIMGLQEDLPPQLGAAERDAIAALKNGPAKNGAAPAAEPADLEFELDFGASAPTAKFNAASVSDDEDTSTLKVPGRGGPNQPETDLLAIFWGDLAGLGYAIGGADADGIMGELAEEGRGSPGSAAVAAAAPSVASSPSAAPPSPAAPADEEGVIDLGDTVPARRPFQTEVLPAFQLEDEPVSASAGAAAAPSFTDDMGMFGGEDDGGSDFSPLDTSDDGPPAGVLEAQRASTQPAPATAELAPSARAPADAPSVESRSVDVDDADETIMFQPGALDAALLEATREPEVAAPAAAAPEPAPAPAAPAKPEPAPMARDEDDDSDEESTVMFQPGALDAALLAEVAHSAGPETKIAPPPVEQPPEEPRHAPAAAETARGPNGEAETEVHQFLGDYALRSVLHVQALARLSRVEDEVFGAADLHAVIGGSRTAVADVLDQLVQARLVRRTRSPRVRGGSGFVFSASPAARRSVKRLISLWEAADGRAKVAHWLDA